MTQALVYGGLALGLVLCRWAYTSGIEQRSRRKGDLYVIASFLCAFLISMSFAVVASLQVYAMATSP